MSILDVDCQLLIEDNMDELMRAEQTLNPNWSMLPKEIWEKIMGYLERKESNNLIIMALSSKEWKT